MVNLGKMEVDKLKKYMPLISAVPPLPSHVARKVWYKVAERREATW